MKKWMLIIVLAMTAVRPSLLLGQTISLSLSESLDRARQHSLLLKSQDEKILAARAAQHAAESRYYPHFSAEISHNQLFFTPYTYRQQFSTATVDWSPGDWFTKTAIIEAKQTEAQQAEQQVGLDVVRRVSALYLGVLRSQQELALMERRLQILEAHRQVADALWRGGVRTELDVLQTRTAINGSIALRNARRTETDNMNTALAYLLDLPAASTPQLQDIPSRVIEIQPDDIQVALRQNPLLQFLQLQAEAQRLRLQKIQASKWPHLQLRGSYVVDRDPTAAGNYWQAGLGIKIPLFRWGETKFKQQEIEAQTQALHWERSQAQREMKIQQAQISRELDRLRKTYRLQQERLQITEQTLQIATANYLAGLITNLEYLNAQEVTVTTQITLNETRLTYALRLIDNYILTNQPEKIKRLQAAK